MNGTDWAVLTVSLACMAAIAGMAWYCGTAVVEFVRCLLFGTRRP